MPPEVFRKSFKYLKNTFKFELNVFDSREKSNPIKIRHQKTIFRQLEVSPNKVPIGIIVFGPSKSHTELLQNLMAARWLASWLLGVERSTTTTGASGQPACRCGDDADDFSGQGGL